MKLVRRVNKILIATPLERKMYFDRFLGRLCIQISPFFRVFKIPFVSAKEKRNLFMDLLERMTTAGSFIRARYYLGYKLFYSCSKEGTGIINDIMVDRIYEQETCSFLKENIEGNSNPIFIDIGANIGLISLYMLKNVPNIKIFAFEPSPHQQMLLKRTLEENNIENNIILSDYALSDKVGEVAFFAHNEANCSGDGFKDTGRSGNGAVIKVKTTLLDCWWRDNEKPQVNLIKVDTEGAELPVLLGARELLDKCRPTIFFEMQAINYKVYNYTWVDVLSFFDSVNYEIFTETGEIFDNSNAEKLMNNNYNFIAKKRN